MKNIDNDMLKNCIVMSEAMFNTHLEKAFPNIKYYVDMDYEGISIIDEETGIDVCNEPSFLEDLAKYFDISKITSIHIDDCESVIGVWIAYQDNPTKNQNKNNQLAELKGQIVDIFEDYLDKHNVEMTNPEPGLDPDINPNDIAKIYGTDYDLIGDEIEFFFTDRNGESKNGEFKIPDDITENDFENLIDNLVYAFEKILKNHTNGYIPDDDEYDTIRHNIATTLYNWGIRITYIVNFNLNGNVAVKVRAKSMTEAKEKAQFRFDEADYGDLNNGGALNNVGTGNIEGTIFNIKDLNKNVLWSNPHFKDK